MHTALAPLKNLKSNRHKLETVCTRLSLSVFASAFGLAASLTFNGMK